MKLWGSLSCVLLAALCAAQLPPRPLSIPGALLIPGTRPAPLRRISPDFSAPKPRRPNPNAGPVPLREVRPVIEEEEEDDSPSPTSNFDAEVNKLGISALTSAIRQAEDDEEEAARPSPLPFRPERPIPVTRDQIRERPADAPPRPSAAPRPLPVIRQELRPAPSPLPRPVRPVVRQEIDDDDDQPLRQPVRKTRPQPPPQQQFRATAPVQQRAIPRPQPQFEDDGIRRKKPTAQILRKYRTDNDDGSITWGFENDDGTFKEETLGTDCTTRGKYGYFDPDGVKREYTYETGNKCDPQDELDEDEQQPLPNAQPRRPLNVGKPQPQFRPALAQFN